MNLFNSNKIIFAGGCFWGVQNYFSQVRGIINTRVGYTQGIREFPNYEEVCSGATGHTEAVEVEWQTDKTNLNKLLDHYFNIVDPTTLNSQAMDVGTQYRSGIYYYDTRDKEIILKYIEKIKGFYFDEIVTEILPAKEFWDAEDYHQMYLDKNPSGYCHIKKFKYTSIKEIDSELDKLDEIDEKI